MKIYTLLAASCFASSLSCCIIQSKKPASHAVGDSAVQRSAFSKKLLVTGPNWNQLQLYDHMRGAILGAALGDALGRVTEFIETTNDIKKKYGPQGVTSFKSFSDDDWIELKPGNIKIAAYTDDTVMSKIVLEEALTGRTKQYSPEKIIENISSCFIELFGKDKYSIDPLYDVRAHGPTNIKNSQSSLGQALMDGTDSCQPYSPYCDKNNSLSIKHFSTKKNEKIASEGGCGSVMRAWPLGLIFHDNKALIERLADEQSYLTHRHPMARAASVAIAVGVASALQSGIEKNSKKQNDLSPEKVVEEMIKAAERFTEAEKVYKPFAQKITMDTIITKNLLAEDKLLTADLIRYAAKAAAEARLPEEILGIHNIKQKNHRSPQGFLLSWAADEAVAAAVYIFLRHPDDLQAALIEAVNTPGDSDSIATLAGALVGARTGWKKFMATGFDFSQLEQLDQLEHLAREATIVFKNRPA